MTWEKWPRAWRVWWSGDLDHPTAEIAPEGGLPSFGLGVL